MITYYTKRRLRRRGSGGVSGAFATLAPMVRELPGARIFEEPVELDDKVVLRRLAENDAQELVRQAFAEAIRGLRSDRARGDDQGDGDQDVRDAAVPLVADDRRVRADGLQPDRRSTTTSRRASRCSSTALRTSRLGRSCTMFGRFALEYIAEDGALRYYYPDFVVRLSDDSCLLVETKGIGPRRPAQGPASAPLVPGRDAAHGPRVVLREGPSGGLRRVYGRSVEALRRFVDARLGQPDDVVQDS